MNIKGHAVVELRDVETGKIQRVEHDNMLTNGLKYCLTPWLGKFSYATGGLTPQRMPNETTETRKSGNRSMMNHLLGGIFLFQNNLEENADNVAFPTDNPLIGKGSWDAYSGIDTYRGSYNENESGLQDDGSYKHVWDFSTDQANGQISALALTTYEGGICGCGFQKWNYDTESAISSKPFFELGEIKIDNDMVSSFKPFIRMSLNEIYFSIYQYNMEYNITYKEEHLSNLKKILLIKKKFPINCISPFYDYYNQYYAEEIEIEVPEEFATFATNSTCTNETSDTYVYIYKSESIAAGKSVKIMRIRKSDLTTDVITVTNGTSYTLFFNGEVRFTDVFCFVWGTGKEGDNYLYRIILSNSDIAQVLEKTQTSMFGYDMCMINGYLYLNYSVKDARCINTHTLEAKEHPYFKDSINNNHKILNTDRAAKNVFLQFISYKQSTSSKYGYAKVYLLANTLMTINNLSSPVVKTAAQTMKVTYTIQETEQ